MNESPHIDQNRAKVVNALAVVGFIALIGGGMALAVYSTRYVPAVVGRLGAAAVYLGSAFTPAEDPTLSVVPTQTASTTISFGEASASAVEVQKPVAPKSIPTKPGEKTTGTYPINGTSTVVTSTGLPDLVTSIKAVGYLTTASPDSFVASSTAPAGSRPAVNFVIKNVGTGATGQWCFSATIPTESLYLYQSKPQQSLNSGDSIEYTLGFDQAYRGADQMISVTANIANTANTATCARTITESNGNNNSASAKLTIIGS